jgi:hypothetical protein
MSARDFQLNVEMRDALEAMIDKTSLVAVVEALRDIADEKSSHIVANWQDAKTAKPWERAAGRLDTLAANIDI